MNRYIILFFIFCLFGCRSENKGIRAGQAGTDEFIRREQMILDSINVCSNSGRWDAVISIARSEYDTAVKYGNQQYRLFLGMGLAEAYMRIDSVDAAGVLINSLLPVAEKENNRRILGMLYNAYGMYSLFYKPDYNEAADYFMKAAECADTMIAYEKDNYMRIISNLSHIYNLRADTTGLQYSMQVYKYGRKMDNKFLIYVGAINTATQYLLRKDWSLSLFYIEEALEIAAETRMHSDAEAYTIYADAIAGLGDRAMAEKYYRKAMEMSSETEASIVCGLYCSYGNFLMEDSRWKEAADIFARGIELAVNSKTYMHRDRLYLGLSKACGKMGDVAEELENFKIYHCLSDSIFHAEKERSMKELWGKYEAEKTKNLLNEREMQLVRKNRRLYLYVFMIMLLIVIASVFMLMYRHKRKMYEQLVAIHYGRFRREQIKRESSSEGTGMEVETKVSGFVSGKENGEKLENLYNRIEKLMIDEKLYKKEDISLEGLANLMGINRTYISAAINRFAGTNFRDYIKSLRVNDAVKLLSDTDNDTPIKAMFADLGFQSLSSFYTAFQASTGVPPSQYRKEVRRMKKSDFS